MANTARDTFLWQGALLEPFTGLIDWSLPAGASSRFVFYDSLFAARGFAPPTTRPRLLASAATETRFLSQTPLTRFCNLVNAKTDTPTSVGYLTRNDCFRSLRLLAPTFAESSCEQYGTETHLA
jgi:hypothetical protein